MAGLRRALVVDDEESIREVMIAALSKCGFSTEVAEAAEAGLELFYAGRF